ncbi:MAG: hypothetical protein SNG35_08865 [Rikenellaceae bacterium]
MNRVLLSAILFLVAVSCSALDPIDLPVEKSSEGNGEVSFVVGEGVKSRTELDPDGTTVRWSIGDEVALWAEGETSGAEILNGDKFTLKYYSATFDVAEFSANSTSLANFSSMGNGELYSYKAVYPYTANVSGSEVTWTLPAIQSGLYDGDLDLRVADPVEGVAALSDAEAVKCNLKFRSILHQLRVTIPAGYNGLNTENGDERISQLSITLPFECVGSVTVDTDDLEAEAQLTNGSTSVMVKLSESIQAGEGDEIYIFIMPASNVSGDLEVVAIGENNSVSEVTTIELDNVNFTAGKYSSVGATIGEALPATTILDFSIGSYAKLGEPVNKITVTAPEGVSFVGYGSEATLDLSAGQTQLIYQSLDDDTSYDDIVVKSGLSIEYESDNAIVSGTWSATEFNYAGTNNISLTVPYLFEENFDGVGTFHSGDNLATGSGVSASGTNYGIELGTSYGLSNSGWTGYMVGADSCGAIRVCSRVEIASSSSMTYYNGRLDSPQLAALKNSDVPVKVSYNYKGGYSVKRKSGVASATVTGYYNSGYSNTETNSLTAYGVDFTGSGTSGDIDGASVSSTSNSSSTQTYTSINNDDSFTISKASASTRISWEITYSTCTINAWLLWSTFVGDANVWFYVDNVTVSIDHSSAD